MKLILIATFGILLALGGLLFWWRRRRRRTRLISLVALLRVPVNFDPAVLARTASRVWNADLGDGREEGADGFAVGVGPMNTIVHDGRMFLINCIPLPYVDDPVKASESIPDLRIRQHFAEHRAWFSCDAMGVDGTTSRAEVAGHYRRLAKLFAELLDENCLLILVPDTQRAYAINDETEKALRSDDPVAALQETLSLPVIAVADDDPLMRKAVEEAREKLPQFVAAFEANSGGNFSIKAPVTHGGVTEFIWIEVTAVEGERIYGKLANDPANLGPLKLGSRVHVPVKEVCDWCFVDPQDQLQGGFTIAAVRDAARRHREN